MICDWCACIFSNLSVWYWIKYKNLVTYFYATSSSIHFWNNWTSLFKKVGCGYIISSLKSTFPKGILFDTLQILQVFFQYRRYLSCSLTVQKYPFMTTLLPFNCTRCLSLAIKVNCFRCIKHLYNTFLKSHRRK